MSREFQGREVKDLAFGPRLAAAVVERTPKKTQAARDAKKPNRKKGGRRGARS